MPEAAYGIVRHVPVPYQRAVELTRESLKQQGFGILTEIDVRATLKEKLGLEFRPYIILGACNPPLAHRALTAELDIGLMLPCNVVVYQEDEAMSVVEAISPMSALGDMDNPGLHAVAVEAEAKLRAAMDEVAVRASAV